MNLDKVPDIEKKDEMKRKNSKHEDVSRNFWIMALKFCTLSFRPRVTWSEFVNPKTLISNVQNSILKFQFQLSIPQTSNSRSNLWFELSAKHVPSGFLTGLSEN